MRIATWNLNHRAGATRFRPEAASAANSLGADLIAFTEFFPKGHEASFRDSLRSGGLQHQIASFSDVGARVNRVLIASRMPIETHAIEVPGIDIHLPANVLAVRVPELDLTVVAVRVPWYVGEEASNVSKAWDWLRKMAGGLAHRPAVLLGDFNVSILSSASRGGRHFRSILQAGWERANGGGETYFGAAGRKTEIDHILATRTCTLSNPAVVTVSGGIQLAGTSSAVSDHAALLCDVSVTDGRISDER